MSEKNSTVPLFPGSEDDDYGSGLFSRREARAAPAMVTSPDLTADLSNLSFLDTSLNSTLNLTTTLAEEGEEESFLSEATASTGAAGARGRGRGIRARGRADW